MGSVTFAPDMHREGRDPLKRYLALAALASVVFVGACTTAGTPAATSPSDVSASDQADPAITEARREACNTVRRARDEASSDLQNVAVAFTDDELTDELVAQAIAAAGPALTALKPNIVKAVGQTSDAPLKTALTEYAAAIDRAAAAFDKPNTTQAALRTALEDDYSKAEQKALNLCYDVYTQ